MNFDSSTGYRCRFQNFSTNLYIYIYICLEHFQKGRTEEDEEEGQGEESYRSRHRWIADLTTDQLNRFRVNSKRDTLE